MRRWLLVALCAFCSGAQHVEDVIQDSVKGRTDDLEAVADAWTLMAYRGRQQLQYHVEYLQRQYMSWNRDAKVSAACNTAVIRTLNAAKDGRPWAVQSKST